MVPRGPGGSPARCRHIVQGVIFSRTCRLYHPTSYPWPSYSRLWSSARPSFARVLELQGRRQRPSPQQTGTFSWVCSFRCPGGVGVLNIRLGGKIWRCRIRDVRVHPPRCGAGRGTFHPHDKSARRCGCVALGLPGPSSTLRYARHPAGTTCACRDWVPLARSLVYSSLRQTPSRNNVRLPRLGPA